MVLTFKVILLAGIVIWCGMILFSDSGKIFRRFHFSDKELMDLLCDVIVIMLQ